MRLFLCEKPSQAQDIARFLGSSRRGDGFISTPDALLTWAFGHLISFKEPDAYLPESTPKLSSGKKKWRLEDLPIIPKEWMTEPNPQTQAQYKIVIDLLRKASEVVIATDAGREGEMIARELIDAAKYKGSIKRLWVSALNDESLKKGLDSLRNNEETYPLYLAAKARTQADWVMGMNLTRAWTLRARAVHRASGVFSLGRVQTPTLSMLVERDEIIENFKPSSVYSVRARFSLGAHVLDALWMPEDKDYQTLGRLDREKRLIDFQFAKTIEKDVISEGQGLVESSTSTQGKENPPLMYNLGDLQLACDKRFGLSPDETLAVAQALYEKHKVLSYPRTESRHCAKNQHQEAKKTLSGIMGCGLDSFIKKANLTNMSQVWDDKKLTDHHGIIPTGVKPTGMGIIESDIFNMVARRYIAQFYPAHTYQQHVVLVRSAGYQFKASTRTTLNLGWKSVLSLDINEEEAHE